MAGFGVAFAGLFYSTLNTRAGGPYGADNGWAVDHDSGAVLLSATVAQQMSAGETGWIRIEMFLVSGHTTWDATALGYYDTAVNNARAAGLQVLLLIDGGSWPGGQMAWTNNNGENIPGGNGDNPYVAEFATNAVWPIVQHFHDRVKVYELWNEPNCWNSNPAPGVYTGCTFMYPSNFGWMLARSWEAVHITHQVNDVTLLFGGVFGHNISSISSYANAGAQYIDDTYSTGTNIQKGGSFTYSKANYHAYPLDGIGQHLYLSQGGLVASNTFRQYLDWVRSACTKYEGVTTPKKTFITEFGWTTTSVSQAVQDTNLVTSFAALDSASYVQMAIWFQWADNPAGAMYYGVTNDATGPKPAFADYQRFERFEGLYSNGATNTAIAAYFRGLGQAVLGDPFDHGSTAWVHSWLNGYAQDYAGGAHLNLTVMSSTNGTFEVNNRHGLWSYYNTNNGATAFGWPLDNEYSSDGGTRQDFTRGYLAWSGLNQVLWYPRALVVWRGAAPEHNVVLSWNGAYTLQAATNASGPFLDVAGAVSPFTNSTSVVQQQFFRLRN
ncbi:MAG TPA: hypothetical protein VG167_10765 [Verrucomicrobiae bacterium]|nr:hypothetical protein [Verrucomicrobiae bacterium]